MTLNGRDHQIVQLVARFCQATAGDFHALLFPHTVHRNPCDRALLRLTDRTYLRRVERRAVGGRRGGSGQFVYVLGKAGHDEFVRKTKPDGRLYVPRYIPQRRVNYHSLTILEVFRTLMARHRAGQFQLLGYTTEQGGDAWLKVGGEWLQPDLYVDLAREGRKRQLVIEVDMATQSHGQIRAKFERYSRAVEASDLDSWPEYRKVLFAAIDEERVAELKWLMSQCKLADEELFRIVSVQDLATAPL